MTKLRDVDGSATFLGLLTATTLACVLSACGGGSEDDGSESSGSGGSVSSSGGVSNTTGGAPGTGGSGDLGDLECPEGQFNCSGTCVGNGATSEKCTILAQPTGEFALESLSSDDTYLYWAQIGYSLQRMQKTGGSPEVVFESQNYLQYAVPNSSSLLFVEQVDFGRTLRVVPKNGGTATDLASDQSNQFEHVVVTEDRVFFSHGSGSSEVASIGLSAQDPIVHGTATRVSNIVLDGGNLYYLSEGFPGWEVRKASQTAAGDEVLTTVEDPLNLYMAGADGQLFLASDGSLLTMPTTGGTPSKVYDMPLDYAMHFAVFGSRVYFGNYGELWSVSTTGTDAKQLLTTSSAIEAFTVDASGVYVALNSDNDEPFLVKLQE